MARTSVFSDNFIGFAVDEIEATYGHNVRVNRKSLHKFGRNEDVGTTQEIVNYLGIDPAYSTSNDITHFSSSNAADTQTLMVEGMTYSGGDLSFVAQNITLAGQTKTALTTPLARVTRIANTSSATATAGDVYVYKDVAVTAGVPTVVAGNTGNVMPASGQSTLFGGTSVASTNYLVITELAVYENKKTGSAQTDIEFQIRPVGGVWRSVAVGSVSNSSNIQRLSAPHFIVPPNTDIRVMATGSTTGIDISASFSGYFADIIS